MSSVLVLDTSGMVQSAIYPEPSAAWQGVFALNLANPNAITTTNGNLLLVLDISNSMAGEKIKRLRESAKLIVDQLPDRTRLLILVFSTDWHVLEVYKSQTFLGYPRQGVLLNPVEKKKNKVVEWGDIDVTSETRDAIKDAIDGIDDDSSTQFAGAHTYGLQWLTARTGPLFAITITDGQSTDQFTDDAYMPKFGKGVAELGGKWIAAGIGDDYDHARLGKWIAAAEANGLLVHIKDVTTDIQAVFNAVAAKLSRAVFNNIELSVHANAGVKIQEVIFRSTPPAIMNVSNPYLFQHPNVGSLDKLVGIQYAITFEFEDEPTVQDNFEVAVVEIKMRDGTNQLPTEVFTLTVNISDDALAVRRSVNNDSYITLQQTRAQAYGSTAVQTLQESPNSVAGQTMLKTAMTAAEDAGDQELAQLLQDLGGFQSGFGGGQNSQYREQLSQLRVRGDTDFEHGFGGKS